MLLEVDNMGDRNIVLVHSLNALYHRLSELNNVGADWISIDPYFSAFLFQLALDTPISNEQLQFLISRTDLQEHRCADESNQATISASVSDTAVSCGPGTTEIGSGDRFQVEKYDYDEYTGRSNYEEDVFIRPVRLGPTADVLSMCYPLSNLGVIVGVILTNLAIALHRQALMAQRGTIVAQHLLEAAQATYCNAEKTLEKVGTSFTRANGHTALMDVLVMGILMNKAQCAARLTNDSGAYALMQQLMTYSHTVPVHQPWRYEAGAGTFRDLLVHITHFRTIASLWVPATGASAA